MPDVSSIHYSEKITGLDKERGSFFSSFKRAFKLLIYREKLIWLIATERTSTKSQKLPDELSKYNIKLTVIPRFIGRVTMDDIVASIKTTSNFTTDPKITFGSTCINRNGFCLSPFWQQLIFQWKTRWKLWWFRYIWSHGSSRN